MSNKIKILIVVALVGTVGAVLVLKSSNRPAQRVADKPSAESVVKPGVATGLPRLVDLGAGKCIPCKMMAPILEEMKKQYAGKLDVEFVDVWQNPDVAWKQAVEIIPTQIFFDAAGKELFRHTGFFGKEDMLAKWKELGVDLTR